MSQQMIQSLSNLKAKYMVDDIIKALQENLKAHKQEYTDALKGWRKAVVAEVERLNSEYTSSSEFMTVEYSKLAQLRPPINCETGYTKAIMAFDRMIDKEIELDFDVANHIFNDDWDWAITAKLSNASYSSMR